MKNSILDLFGPVSGKTVGAWNAPILLALVGAALLATGCASTGLYDRSDNDLSSPKLGDSRGATVPTPLYLGMTYHLEGNLTDREMIKILDFHLEKFNTHDSVATIESRCQSSRTCDRKSCDDYFAQSQFNRYIEAGHAIGLHADICGSRSCKSGTECATPKAMASALDTMRKKLVLEAKLPPGHVRHVSGVCSKNWATAVTQSDFSFVTGVIDYCLDHLPGWRKKCPTPDDCKDPWPGTLPQLLHPWMVESNPPAGRDWTSGVISSPTYNFLPGFAVVPSAGVYMCLDSDCDNGNAQTDMDEFFFILDNAIRHHRTSPEHDDFLHVKLNLGNPGPDQLGKLLRVIKNRYVKTGKVEWMSIPAMYDKFLEAFPLPRPDYDELAP